MQEVISIPKLQVFEDEKEDGERNQAVLSVFPLCKLWD